MAFIIFLFGLMVGSFLNVCIYRLPRGESVVTPPSHCPHCNKRIKILHLIPVISYLLLKGKCGYCQKPFSIRYPLIELLVGLLSLLLFFHFSWDLLSFGRALFISYLLVVVTFTDLDEGIIPDEVNLIGLLGGFLFSFFLQGFSPLDSLLGILVGGGSLLLVALISRGGMGGGDVKLMAMVGSFLGWAGALGTIFIGAILGSIVSLVIRRGLKETIPFGPFLAMATILVLLYGEELLYWYLKLFSGL